MMRHDTVLPPCLTQARARVRPAVDDPLTPRASLARQLGIRVVRECHHTTFELYSHNGSSHLTKNCVQETSGLLAVSITRAGMRSLVPHFPLRSSCRTLANGAQNPYEIEVFCRFGA